MTDKHEHTPGMVMPEKTSASPTEAAKPAEQGKSTPTAPVSKEPVKVDEKEHNHK